MERVHGRRAIGLDVTSVNMLIQTVGDIRVPQREWSTADRTLQRKQRTDEREMSALKAREGNCFQMAVVCVTCDKRCRKRNVTRKV